MGKLVWSACTAHTAAMLRDPEGEQAKRIFAGFDYLKATLKQAKPDILVIIGTDHMMTFSYEGVPTFALGTGEAFPTWGEAGSRKTTYKGIGEFGDRVGEGMIEGGFDVCLMAEMRIDHAFACPLSFLMDDTEIPILPIYINCTVPPLPTHARCHSFGVQLGKVLRDQESAQRVALVGTGGLSHWIGLPKSGLINEDFDRSFLELFEAGNLEAIASMESDRVISDAGNGAAEIRNWLAASAAAGNRMARRIAYEPVAAWKTGIGLVELGQ
ncbi:hypothetical protein [Bradyrhizobium sp. NP1]|uniref:DODA-type extradiol aromatic ring-opening family dioxygenase n=1 Tax=Bradyrhizobium sp. NP1 TaxID=3049772 RepID=UPI0025A61479|nr:hypothetical protein [Bradyrhizobium sp. NP1]WJR75851.1 hypothetical protein QOU61_24095 [Bradyrhizobium sp. NP1]